MSRPAPIRWLLALALLVPGLLAAAPAGVGASPITPDCRWLFVVDTSATMQRQADGLYRSTHRLVATGLGGRMQEGDVFTVWTYADAVLTREFPLNAWTPDLNIALANRTYEFLARQKFRGKSNLRPVFAELGQALAIATNLTILLVSDGTDVIVGTPFDRAINVTYGRRASEMRAAKIPFVTALVTRGGEFTQWSVRAGLEDIGLPLPPKPAPPAVLAPVAPAPPAPKLVIAENPPPKPPPATPPAPAPKQETKTTPPPKPPTPTVEMPKPTPSPPQPRPPSVTNAPPPLAAKTPVASPPPLAPPAPKPMTNAPIAAPAAPKSPAANPPAPTPVPKPEPKPTTPLPPPPKIVVETPKPISPPVKPATTPAPPVIPPGSRPPQLVTAVSNTVAKVELLRPPATTSAPPVKPLAARVIEPPPAPRPTTNSVVPKLVSLPATNAPVVKAATNAPVVATTPKLAPPVAPVPPTPKPPAAKPAETNPPVVVTHLPARPYPPVLASAPPQTNAAPVASTNAVAKAAAANEAKPAPALVKTVVAPKAKGTNAPAGPLAVASGAQRGGWGYLAAALGLFLLAGGIIAHLLRPRPQPSTISQSLDDRHG